MADLYHYGFRAFALGGLRKDPVYSYTIEPITRPIKYIEYGLSIHGSNSFNKTKRIQFEGIVCQEVINLCKHVLILPGHKSAGDIYKDIISTKNSVTLESFNGYISFGSFPNWEFIMTSLSVSNDKTILEYTEENFYTLDLVVIRNLRSVVSGIIYNYLKGGNINELGFYQALQSALTKRAVELEQKESRTEVNTIIKGSTRYLSSDSFKNRIINNVFAINMGVPMIDRVVYNAPNTVVFWKDGTSTTVTATEGEEFNKEIGLAMAISRKYFAVRENNPRAAFKNVVKNADDYTAASEHKRQQKERKLQKKAESENGCTE